MVKLLKETDKITVLEFSLESGTSEAAIAAAINHSSRIDGAAREAH